MALGILLISFIVMCVVSGLGILFLCLAKEGRGKKIVFYFLAVWALLLSAIGAMSLPSNHLAGQVMAWGFGFLSVLAIIVHVKAKTILHFRVAYGIVALSNILVILRLFF